MAALRILVVDAYPREGRARLADAGGTEAGELYRRMLERWGGDLRVEVVHPADDERPEARELADYDGALWTGSNLSVLDADAPRVARQIDLARELLAAGVPGFGSCFAIQLATVALGGRCAASPRGREFGISRRIRLSADGRSHPLYRDKPAVFDAFTSHADEVVALPPGTRLLASNDWSNVQAASLARPAPGAPAAPFWAVQYHPEYDLHEVASLCCLRRRELVQQGTFPSEEAADAWVADLEALHADPSRSDIARRLDVGDSLLDEVVRTREVRNWLASIGDRA